MKQKLGLLTALAALVLVVIGLVTFDRLESPRVAGVQVETPAPAEFSYPGQEGRTALELLKENYAVETENFSFGEMVTTIDGIAADQSHFWAFYVNGEMAVVGAGEYQSDGSETFEWRLKEIE